MHYFEYATKDTTLYSRSGSQNTGIDEILEVVKDVSSAGVVSNAVVGYNSLPTILNLTIEFSLYSCLKFWKYIFSLSKSVVVNGDKLPVEKELSSQTTSNLGG